MSASRRSPKLRKFIPTLVTIEEDSVPLDWEFTDTQAPAPLASQRQPPESRVQPPNFSDSSLQQVRSLHPPRMADLPPVPSDLQSSNRMWIKVSPATPLEPAITDHHSTSTSPGQIPFSSFKLKIVDKARKESTRICHAICDVWIEVKSRVLWESRIKREARKKRETKKRECAAEIKIKDASMRDQLKIHRTNEKRRNSNAKEEAKRNKVVTKAREKRRKKVAKEAQKEGKDSKRKEEWKR